MPNASFSFKYWVDRTGRLEIECSLVHRILAGQALAVVAPSDIYRDN